MNETSVDSSPSLLSMSKNFDYCFSCVLNEVSGFWKEESTDGSLLSCSESYSSRISIAGRRLSGSLSKNMTCSSGISTSQVFSNSALNLANEDFSGIDLSQKVRQRKVLAGRKVLISGGMALIACF